MSASKRRGPQTVFHSTSGSGLEVQGSRIPRMPLIAMPNATGNTYRRKKSKRPGPVPVSATEKVLTQDNHYADTMLTKQLQKIQTDRHRAEKIHERQQQSFVVKQAIKETELREIGVNHISFLPEITMNTSEPDVRSRRPFGRFSRRYDDQIKEITAAERSLKLPDITFVKREKTDMVARLHGFDLPLYGPEEDAKKEQRKREIVKKRQQESTNCLKDTRFVDLERTLTRNGRTFPETAWRFDKSQTAQTDEDQIDEGN